MVKNGTATNKEQKMNLTKEKVNKLIESAERNGFTKESVFSSIKQNKALDKRAKQIAVNFWSK
jgi:hypothetical protein